jgi:threonine/homoserine/homoserine lactone efflux protein
VTPRRCCHAAGTVAPAAMLVLLPKCPACIVAYIAIGTGLGVTVTTAAYLRTGILVFCVACLVWMMARLWRSRQGGPHHPGPLLPASPPS